MKVPVLDVPDSMLSMMAMPPAAVMLTRYPQHAALPFNAPEFSRPPPKRMLMNAAWYAAPEADADMVFLPAPCHNIFAAEMHDEAQMMMR